MSVALSCASASLATSQASFSVSFSAFSAAVNSFSASFSSLFVAVSCLSTSSSVSDGDGSEPFGCSPTGTTGTSTVAIGETMRCCSPTVLTSVSMVGVASGCATLPACLTVWLSVRASFVVVMGFSAESLRSCCLFSAVISALWFNCSDSFSRSLFISSVALSSRFCINLTWNSSSLSLPLRLNFTAIITVMKITIVEYIYREKSSYITFCCGFSYTIKV